MAITVVTGPTSEPVTLTAAKLHLRVDATDDDTLITSLIVAARKYCERFCRRTFPSQTLKLTLDNFPCGWTPIALPYPPLVSVSSVVYVDTAGTSQAWASSNYKVLPADSERGRIAPAFALIWPVARQEIGAVQITYVAGYTTVPETVAQAMLLLIGHWYTNREAAAESIPKVLELAVDSLLMSERTEL